MACNFPHCILTGQFLYFPWEARVMGRRLTAAFAECYRQSSCELLFTAASRQFLLFGCQLPSLLDAGMNVDYLRSAARILVLINFLESWASASFDAASLSSWPPEACLCLVPWWQVPIPAHVRLCLNLFIHTFFLFSNTLRKAQTPIFANFFICLIWLWFILPVLKQNWIIFIKRNLSCVIVCRCQWCQWCIHQ